MAEGVVFSDIRTSEPPGSEPITLSPAPAAKAILLSIRPRYAELILAGDKTVELRKRCPSLPAGTLVVMYASAPTCAIVGAFELGGILRLPPAELWASHGDRTGVSRELFERYYEGRGEAVGLVVGEVLRLSQRVELGRLRELWDAFHPPQSYRYLHGARSGARLRLEFAGRTESLALRAAS